MMKKLIFICTLITILCGTIIVSANDTVDVYVNGKKLVTDQSAIIYQDRTMVPLRAICEALKCEVEWDNDTDTALIQNKITMVAVQVDNYNLTKKERTVDGGKEKTVAIDVAPFILNGRTLVPARAISESLNAIVKWNELSNTVDITLEYDWIGDFYNGYAKVLKDGKLGFINKNRELVIPLIYDNDIDDESWFSNQQFEKNKYVIVKKNGYKGIVDSRNDILVPFEYEELWYSDEWETYHATKNGKEGRFDKDLSILIPCIYDLIFDKGISGNSEFFDCLLNGKIACCIDRNGKIVYSSN